MTNRQTLIEKLRVTSLVLSGLPKLPGYDGSILILDDVEAARIVSDINEVVTAIDAMGETV